MVRADESGAGGASPGAGTGQGGGPANSGLGAWPWALILGCAALYLSAVRPMWGVTADDAYISLRYAKLWAAGCGPVYNCGEPAVEGYTNFLWVALGALTIRLGGDPVGLLRTVGLVCGFFALLLTVPLCRRIHGERAALWLPLLGLGASPFWAVNSVSGLETMAATSAVLGAALLSLDLPSGRRTFWPGVAWAVAYLLRPEGMVLGGVTGLWAVALWIHGRVDLRELWRRGSRLAGGFLLVGGPYFVWRVLYYGALYPNTYYAKQYPLGEVLPRNLRYLLVHPLFVLSLVAGALLALALRRQARVLYPVMLAAVSAGISISVHNNFWMPGHRLYLTAAALLAVAAAGLGTLWPGAGPVRRRLGTALALALLGILLLSAWRHGETTRKEAHLHYAGDNHPARKMGEKIRAMARPGDWLAIRDAGMVPYYAGPRVRVLDMHDHSLNDRFIAKNGWQLRYILQRDPRFVVFASRVRHPLIFAHGVEAQIFRAPGFAARYQHVMTIPWHLHRWFKLYAREPKPVDITTEK